MEDRVNQLLSWCSEIDFGYIHRPKGENEFYRRLNSEIIVLCKSLPKSAQTDALLFFMQYSGVSLGQDLDFFGSFYNPSWSIIYWLIESTPNERRLTEKDIKNAITAHSMAMSLHSFDDHLDDNELPATHLTLLLRSQSWMIMKIAFSKLADGIDEGEKIVEDFIDDYYSSVQSSMEIKCLDSYCDLFRKQMATGMIVPVLLTKKMATSEGFTGAVRVAFEAFGIAWRLLDDIKDIETDMLKSSQSAIYICLPKKIKTFWDRFKEEKSDKKIDFTRIIMDCILENGVIKRIINRICSELELAASVADEHNITGLADEFRCLLKPLQNRRAGL